MISVRIGCVLLSLLCLFTLQCNGIRLGNEVADPRREAIKQFEKWFIDQLSELGVHPYNGRKVMAGEKVKLKVTIKKDENINNDESEFGIFAKEDIQEGEEIIRIPFNLMLTSSRIMEATQIGLMLEEREDIVLTDREVIALYILYLKLCQPNINPWLYWIQSLPLSSNSILNFRESEMKLLEGSPIYVRAQKRREHLVKVGVLLQKAFEQINQEVCQFDLEDWRWANSIVDSRVIDLLDEDDHRFSTVIPFFDYFNHMDNKLEKFSWGYKAEHKFFHAEASRKLKRGEQAFVFYGAFSNSKLLESYGFILEPINEHDSVLFETHYFGVDPEDPFYQKKQEMLKDLLTEKREERLLLMRNVSMTQDLYDAVRVVNAQEEDFLADGRKLARKPSLLTEFFIAKWFQAVCLHKLQRYPTSLEEDEEQMRLSIFTAMSERSQMAIKVILGEKKILRETLEYFTRKEHELLQASRAHAHQEL